jgi:BTB/POZ domain
MLTSNEPLPNLLFEYHGADIILCSRDVHHFRVPKVYIVNCSAVLEASIKKLLDLPRDVHGEESLPLIQLPESGAILHSLLTFIFPVTPIIPSTIEESMELLSVAQKYQMDSVLAHIRLSVAQQNPPPSQRNSAMYMYSLAQKYGLRQEALQAARTVLKYPINIEALKDELDVVSGASLYELQKYYEKVRAILASDLTEFRTSGAHGTLTGLRCKEITSSQIPCWIDIYIEDLRDDISLFDFIEFNYDLVCHMEVESGNPRCECHYIRSQTIREFWEALESVVDGSFKKVSLLDVESCI